MARTHSALPLLPQALRTATASAGYEMCLPTEPIIYCLYSLPPNRGLKGCGHDLMVRDAAFYRCSPRMDSSRGAGGCRMSLCRVAAWGDMCSPKALCISRTALLTAEYFQRPWAWCPCGLCLHNSGVTPERSMGKEKHVKQKSHPRLPGQFFRGREVISHSRKGGFIISQ